MPQIGNRLLGPINIPGIESGHVRLRPANMPEEPIERAVLGVALASDDFLMLFPSDGPFWLELDFRPLSFRNDGFWNPVHIEGEIMQPAQKDIGRNRAFVHRVKKMLGLSFDQDKLANRIKRLVFHGNFPPSPGAARFWSAHFIHDVLPGAFGKLRVAVLQIDLGDLQIDRGLFAGFVKGIQEPLSLVWIGRVKAVSFLREGVEGVEDAVLSAERLVSLFHGSFCYRASHSPRPTG